jgi:hypothetical protein
MIIAVFIGILIWKNRFVRLLPDKPNEPLTIKQVIVISIIFAAGLVPIIIYTILEYLK